ncbi:MAG: patatin-like phospholipase family protein [Bacteroidetes bacterium]|nr:patatin-like phospholipase family protein [Bacteroidota bacterium]
MLSDFFENRLREALQTLFGTLDDNTFSGIQTFFEWVDVQGGACLFRQGDEADGMYVVASGRLRVFQQSAEGKRDAIAEIAAGETVGEMALITGEPRNADVMAMRDSVLARISLKDFERLTSIYPQALLHISRNIIERLQKRSAAVRRTKRINNIGVCPVSEGADKNSFVHALRQTLSEHGEVLCIDSKSVDQSIGMPGISQCARGDSAPYRHLASWLEQQESLYRFVLYIPDEEDSEWTHRCFRQADEVLLVGVAGQSSEIHPLEKRYLSSDEYHSLPGQSLVLLHAPDTQAPTGTAAWLQGRNLNFHHHVRQEHAGDFARLARFMAGKAVGLVLSGGAAKGFAHIGVVRALEEAGIPIDLVGGTSMGAVMGALVARGWDGNTMRARCREVFKKSPTDINLVPRVSIFKGRKLDSMLQEHFGHLMIEDSWLNFFCVSCNLTRNAPCFHYSGVLSTALRASISIPGVFPPAEVDNELYVDGGVFDNMPVEEMSRLGAGVIIAVDLQVHRKEEQLDTDVYRKRKLPNLLFVVMESSMLSGRYHAQTHKNLVDFYFNPPLQSVSLIDWNKFDLIEDTGYRHARETLIQMQKGVLTGQP